MESYKIFPIFFHAWKPSFRVFRFFLEKENIPWKDEYGDIFSDRRQKDHWIRKKFLNSDVGIGIVADTAHAYGSCIALTRIIGRALARELLHRDKSFRSYRDLVVLARTLCRKEYGHRILACA